MRYMIVHKTAEYFDKANPPPPDFIARMNGFMQAVNQAGVLLAAEGLRHPDHGRKITVEAGRTSVSDGPYAEAKEVIGGFVMIDVLSADDALEWATRFADCFDDVEVEVRPIVEASDFQ